MKSFKDYLEETHEYGEVTSIKAGLVTASGLPSVRLNEIVLFEEHGAGQIFSIDEKGVDIVVLNHHLPSLGEKIAGSRTFASIPVGKNILGNCLNSLGVSLLNKNFEAEEMREVDIDPASITTRTRIDKPLFTGVSLIDLTLPLGHGQKELVLGDRQTGKTDFLLSVLKNQVELGTVAIYCLIGKRKSELKKVLEFLQTNRIMERTVVIASTADESAGFIHLNPYAGMTIAEYFRDQGQNAVLILDDLSIHAKNYREISLLARHFPGRESYPGDIFYIHARLLERTGNYIVNKKKDEAAITCLPVIETLGGDLTSYISTNLMGMTDGHIFFDSSLFQKGKRPAINLFLSVTRVGKQTLNPLRREIARTLTAFLVEYEKALSYSHFGAELPFQVKLTLERGNNLEQFFEEKTNLFLPENFQLVLLGLIWESVIDKENIQKMREALFKLKTNAQIISMFDEIAKEKNAADFFAKIKMKASEILEMVNQKSGEAGKSGESEGLKI